MQSAKSFIEHRHPWRIRLGVVCGIGAGLIFATGCDPHKPTTESGEQTIPESASSAGAASVNVKTNWAAPTSPLTLVVTVTSPDVLSDGDATVQVRMTCQLGTTKTFDMSLTSASQGGRTVLQGTFSRAANSPSGDECVNAQGQKEAVMWTVTFSRTNQTTQELSFAYSMDYRLAAIAED